MAVFQLSEQLAFPPADLAEPDGLLAIGGDLAPERLVLAYANGIFPWPQEGYPLLWFSPPRRMVLPVSELHVPRRLARRLRQRRFDVRLDTSFGRVVRMCATVPRPDQEGTWITDEMTTAYERLHILGLAHSVESWRSGALVGGLYGVCLGALFVAESMFTIEDDAGKAALVTLVRQLRAWGISLFDAQLHTEHAARFGAREWPRRRYLERLPALVGEPTRIGAWRIDVDPADVPARTARPDRR